MPSFRLFRHAWVLGLLLCRAGPVPAGGLSLGTVDLPVPDRTAPVRAGAVRAALTQVLVRLTGNPEITAEARVAPLLDTARRYLRSFRYRAQAAEGEAPVLHFVARFDLDAVQQALLRAQVPVWGQDRPPVLLWLGVERHGRRFVLTDDDDPELDARLRGAARRLGLPLMLPLMDLQDRAAVHFPDIRGGFIERAVAAGRRYAAPVVVMASLRETAGGVSIHWWLAFGQVQDEWLSSGLDDATALDRGLGHLLQRLSQLLAVRPAGGHAQVPVLVQDVHSAADYARVTRVLAGLTGVEAVRLAQVTADAVALDLTLDGGADSMKRLMRGTEALELVQDDPSFVIRLRR